MPRHWFSKQTDFFAANADFYNLPRKFKISITGCPVWCSYPEINDIGLTAVRRSGAGLRSGIFSSGRWRPLDRSSSGGSSKCLCALGAGNSGHRRESPKYFAKVQTLREHRERARLKFLFLKQGWTAEQFLDELQRRIGFSSRTGSGGKAAE